MLRVVEIIRQQGADQTVAFVGMAVGKLKTSSCSGEGTKPDDIEINALRA